MSHFLLGSIPVGAKIFHNCYFLFVIDGYIGNRGCWFRFWSQIFNIMKRYVINDVILRHNYDFCILYALYEQFSCDFRAGKSSKDNKWLECYLRGSRADAVQWWRRHRGGGGHVHCGRLDKLADVKIGLLRRAMRSIGPGLYGWCGRYSTAARECGKLCCDIFHIFVTQLTTWSQLSSACMTRSCLYDHRLFCVNFFKKSSKAHMFCFGFWKKNLEQSKTASRRFLDVLAIILSGLELSQNTFHTYFFEVWIYYIARDF